MADARIRAIITAEDRASQVLSKFSDSAERVGHRVANGMKVAAVAATAAIGASATFAVKSAADFEQNRIAFDTMLGSADKARAMLKQLSDFAARTPFELPEVVTGAKQLLAYNIQAEKVIPTFRALGNIAAGVGKDKLPQLILAFGQTRAATRLTGMELRQFTEAGVPLLTTLARQLGKTEAQIQEMVSEGKIGFPQVEKAIFGMSEEGGKFFNLMDRQSKSFSGVMSNIKDNIGRIAREIVGITETGDIKKGSLFYFLQRGAESLLSWLDAHKDGIVARVTGILGLIKLAITGDFDPSYFAKSLGITEDGPVVTALLGVRDAIKSTVDWFVGQWNTLTTFMQKNTIAQAILGDLAATLGRIGDIITERLVPRVQLLWRQFSPEAREGMKLMAAAFILALNLMARAVEGVLRMIDTLLTRISNVKRAFDNLNRGIANKGDLATVVKEAANLFLPGTPFRAAGGPVAGGRPYIVGERGPELFVPSSSGQVVPNHRLGSSSGSGAMTVNLSVNVGTFVGTEMEKRKLAEELFRAYDELQSARGQGWSQASRAA